MNRMGNEWTAAPEPRYTRDEEAFWDEQVARIFKGAQR